MSWNQYFYSQGLGGRKKWDWTLYTYSKLQHTEGILSEGKNAKYKLGWEPLSKLTAVIEKYILILYVVYWFALVVINIVKNGKAVKCFDYYAYHLWLKRYIFPHYFSLWSKQSSTEERCLHWKPSRIPGHKFPSHFSVSDCYVSSSNSPNPKNWGKKNNKDSYLRF